LYCREGDRKPHRHGYLQKMKQQDSAKTANDATKSKQGLIEEIGSLRRKIAGLEKAEMDRRLAEAARLESEEKYRTLVESTRDLIFIVSERGTYTYVNPQFEHVTGYSVRDLINRPFTFLVAPEYIKATIHRFKKGIRGEDTPPYEADLLNKKGERVPVEFLVTTRYDIAGRAVGRFGIGRDITERRRAEETLKQQSRQLRILSARLSEAEESERKRIARELHDQVGQNLTVVGINLSIVKSKLPAGEMDVLLARLEDSMILVEEITEFTRGLMSDLRPPDMDLLGLVAAIGWYGERFSMRTGVDVIVEGEEIHPRPAPDIENNLFRIVQEVLTNIGKHARAGSARIRTDVTCGMMRLVITDDGVGFDPLQVQKAEERGGWGLMTMAERAEAIGGRFLVESKVGRGTRVTVEVPL
jgi:PAS domain S-box-containing protein